MSLGIIRRVGGIFQKYVCSRGRGGIELRGKGRSEDWKWKRGILLLLSLPLLALLSGCITVHRSVIIVDVPYTYEIKEKAGDIWLELVSKYDGEVFLTGDIEIDVKKRRLYYVIRGLDDWPGRLSEEALKSYAEIILRLQEKLREAGLPYRVYYRKIVKPDWR